MKVVQTDIQVTQASITIPAFTLKNVQLRSRNAKNKFKKNTEIISLTLIQSKMKSNLRISHTTTTSTAKC